MYSVLRSVSISGKMLWVALLLVFLYDSVVFAEGHNNKSAKNIGFENYGNDSGEMVLLNVPVDGVISKSPVTIEMATTTTTEPINSDVKAKMTTSSPADNDYQSMKRAIDTFNEKMEMYMNFYGNEMSFLTTKLNTLKDKLNTLEVLHHEIDQVMNRQNTADQKLQVIQDALFGSQSINGKLDRLEFSVQQLHARIDDVMEKQRKFTPQAVQMKRNKDNDDPLSDSDEQFRNCESKIEQLVAFVHSFAELNRLESTDILNRLGNMQSQLIQFFDVKGTITTNQSGQRNPGNDTTELGFQVVEETTQHLNHWNDTNVLKNIGEPNDGTDVIGIESTEMPSILSNLSDDRKLSTSISKSIRKRKRMTNIRNRAKRNHGINTSTTFQIFQSVNSNHFKQVIQHDGNEHDIRHSETISNFDNPKIDIEIDYDAIKSDKQVSAKYGRPSRNGCHEYYNVDRADEIHRYTTKSGTFERLCSFDRNGSAWTVIQSRGRLLNNLSTPENFNRSWNDYKIGFGNLSGEFWYGNDLIHKLTYDDDMELKIKLEAFDGRSIEFEYEIFRVDSEENRYNLFVSGFKGVNKDLDALAYHHNQDFSTFDRQHDKSGIDDHKACCSCAKSYASGWWFNDCIEANLNGVYRFEPFNNNFVGIVWEKWLGDYSLKATKMMIRPKVNWSSRSAGQDNNENSSKKPPDDP